MSYMVLIEPSDENRQAFAKWCLAQTPRIETASHAGSEVDSELFKQVPEALLVGAHIDGRLYRHVAEEAPAEAAPARRTRQKG